MNVSLNLKIFINLHFLKRSREIYQSWISLNNCIMTTSETWQNIYELIAYVDNDQSSVVRKVLGDKGHEYQLNIELKK